MKVYSDSKSSYVLLRNKNVLDNADFLEGDIFSIVSEKAKIVLINHSSVARTKDALKAEALAIAGVIGANLLKEG